MSLEPSEMTQTVLYAAEVHVGGRVEHVLGYKNKATNLSRSPVNAMVWAVPAVHLGPENLVDTREFPTFMADYAAYVRNDGSRRLSFGGEDDADGFDVFVSGSYMVLVADTAADAVRGLQAMPADRRPPVKPEFFEFLNQRYRTKMPDGTIRVWPILVAAWPGTATVDAEPILLHYEPLDPRRLFLPALDAHDGELPEPVAVPVDHTVVWGTDAPRAYPLDAQALGAFVRGLPVGALRSEVEFTEAVPVQVQPYLLPRVEGRHFETTSTSFSLARATGTPVRDGFLNGDFYVDLDPSEGRRVGVVYRESPWTDAEIKQTEAQKTAC